MVRKEGPREAVRSMSDKNLGGYRTEAEAKKRLAQVEHFKARKNGLLQPSTPKD